MSQKFNSLTIQQRQPQTQCVAAPQKPLRLDSNPTSSSGSASSAKENKLASLVATLV